MNYDADCATRAAQIQLIIFDVDGVLTTGHIVMGQTGEAMKFFHVHDGMGISLAHRAGLKTAIITGRNSQIVHCRGVELGIADIYQGIMNKEAVFGELLAKYRLVPEQAAYVGDDLNDLPVMRKVGLACTVGSAVPEVKERAHFVAGRAGGEGGVREIIEMILKAQHKWEEIVDGYLQSADKEIRQ